MCIKIRGPVGLVIYILSFIVFHVVPVTILAICSFVVAGIAWDEECDDSFMKLSTWLIVNGIIAAIDLVLIGFTTIAGTVFGWMSKLCVIPFVISYAVVTVLYTLFLIVWISIGGALIYNTNNCFVDGAVLWFVTIGALVFNVILIIIQLVFNGAFFCKK